MAPCLPPLMGSLEYASVTVGVALNVLLVYLVLYKTNRELRVYSKALLCNCVTDVSFSVVCFLVDFHMAIVDGNVFYIFTNGVAAGSTPVNHFLLCLYMFGLFMNTMVGAVPFAYRYLLVCRNYTLSNSQYFGFIMLTMALSSALPLAFVSVYFPTSDRLAANLTLGCETSGAFPYLQLDESDTVFKLFPIALGSAMIFVPYIVVLCCSRAIYKTIKNAVMSSNSRRLQQQLTYALLAQVVSPSICMSLPCCIGFAALATGSEVLVRIMPWNSSVLTLVPILTPLCTMWFVKSYRHAALNLVRRALLMRTVDASSSQGSVVRMLKVATIPSRGSRNSSVRTSPA